jgi:hypothetical protein
MGLFGGKGEEELRVSGSPVTARVTYVDDTGRRREDGAQAKLKVRVQIDGGSARGREMEQAKWVPSDRMPRVGDHVQIRFDPDDVDDWAWGDAAMYAPPAALPAMPVPEGFPAPSDHLPDPAADLSDAWKGFAELQASGGIDLGQLQSAIAAAFAQGNVTIEHSSGVVDASGNPALSAQIMETLRQHGVDTGMIENAQAAMLAGSTPEDTTARLARIDNLLEKGLISADEHREQRQRIIESI